MNFSTVTGKLNLQNYKNYIFGFSDYFFFSFSFFSSSSSKERGKAAKKQMKWLKENTVFVLWLLAKWSRVAEVVLPGLKCAFCI